MTTENTPTPTHRGPWAVYAHQDVTRDGNQRRLIVIPADGSSITEQDEAWVRHVLRTARQDVG